MPVLLPLLPCLGACSYLARALLATSAPGLQGHLPALVVPSHWLASTHSPKEQLSQQLCVEQTTPFLE